MDTAYENVDHTCRLHGRAVCAVTQDPTLRPCACFNALLSPLQHSSYFLKHGAGIFILQRVPQIMYLFPQTPQNLSSYGILIQLKQK